MSWWRDIFRQSLYMCFFIIPIPIGAYTIHNGSSAFAALASYLFLSLCIPLLYLKCTEARFGQQELPISRKWFLLMWVIMRIINITMASLGENTVFWEWPTIGRDLVFIVIMYCETSVALLGSYILSRFGGDCRLDPEHIEK